MVQVLQYLISANLLLLVVWGYYRLFLARQARFGWNRAFLLGGIGLSFLLPLLRFTVSGSALPELAVIRTLPEVLIQAEAPQAEAAGFSWGSILFVAYGILALVFISLFLVRTGRLLRMIRRAPRERKAGYTLVHAQDKVGPASFFHYLFWDKALDADPESAAVILAHERCHIRQKHTLDMLLLELLCVFNWFNPVVYLLRRDLRQTHEFLADQAAAEVGGKRALSRLVLARQFGTADLSLANHFHSQIKARIIMLKQKSGHKALFRYLMILPLIGLMVACTSLDRDPAEDGKVNAKLTSGATVPPPGTVDAASSDDVGPNDMIEVDQEPEPLNMKELYGLIQYPEAAKKSKIEGKVLVRVKVGHDGEYLEHLVVKDPEASLTKAVTDHISILKFSPAVKDGKSVKCWVTIPFLFKLK